MEKLEGHFPELSQQKFSSNVVEKCLKLPGAELGERREQIVQEIIKTPLLPRLLQASPQAPSAKNLCQQPVSEDPPAMYIQTTNGHQHTCLGLAAIRRKVLMSLHEAARTENGLCMRPSDCTRLRIKNGFE